MARTRRKIKRRAKSKRKRATLAAKGGRRRQTGGDTTTLEPTTTLGIVDKGSISNTSSLLSYTGSTNEVFKLIDTFNTGVYTVYIFYYRPGARFLVATQLPSAATLPMAMSLAGGGPNIMGTVSNIGALPNNSAARDTYIIGDTMAMYAPGYWVLFPSEMLNGGSQSLTLSTINELVYQAPTTTTRSNCSAVAVAAATSASEAATKAAAAASSAAAAATASAGTGGSGAAEAATKAAAAANQAAVTSTAAAAAAAAAAGLR